VQRHVVEGDEGEEYAGVAWGLFSRLRRSLDGMRGWLTDYVGPEEEYILGGLFGLIDILVRHWRWKSRRM
jgi:hypothetical protein